jgi:hypothetical protein
MATATVQGVRMSQALRVAVATGLVHRQCSSATAVVALTQTLSATEVPLNFVFWISLSLETSNSTIGIPVNFQSFYSLLSFDRQRLH